METLLLRDFRVRSSSHYHLLNIGLPATAFERLLCKLRPWRQTARFDGYRARDYATPGRHQDEVLARLIASR